MSYYARLCRPALLAATVVFAAACADRGDTPRTNDAARESANPGETPRQDASDAAREAGREAGGAVGTAGRAGDAAVQTMDVKTALMADNRIDAGDINVDTDHASKTVVLKGSVPTAAQKTLAEEVAARRAEGYRVRNELTVGRANPDRD